MTARQYSQAPITEAIIDLRVKPRADLQLAELAAVRGDADSAVGRQETIVLAKGQMEVGPGRAASASATTEEHGFRFSSDDEHQICQARLGGFSFSRLAPYQGWQAFASEAQRLWNRYREIARPDAVTRLAVRYINRIDLPGEFVELREYFRTSPEVSPLLPQHMEGFFLQVRLPQNDIEAMLVLNQTIIPPPRKDVVSVVLDQDLFRGQNVPQNEVDIWNYFAVLHDRKNEVFEACITDRTRELIA